MLQIALAGLVINKVLTLKQAEDIFTELKDKKTPDTVTEAVKEILKVKKEIKHD